MRHKIFSKFVLAVSHIKDYITTADNEHHTLLNMSCQKYVHRIYDQQYETDIPIILAFQVLLFSKILFIVPQDPTFWHPLIPPAIRSPQHYVSL